MNDTISIEPAGPIPITPPPPLATFPVTPVGVIVQLPAPLDVTIIVPYPPFGTLLNDKLTLPVCVAVWLGPVL